MLLLRLFPAALFLALPATTAKAQAFEVLFSDNVGRHLVAGLVQGSDGAFYGTTRSGGVSNWGTVFKVTSNGTHIVLHSFKSTSGSTPLAGLVQGNDGDFYGTTSGGGASNRGTVFKITSSGTHTLLHSFNGSNGHYPIAGLVQGSDGDFYGTTHTGGASGHGTVFKITSSGTHTLLHSFNGSNGSQSIAGLVQSSDGDFYGTTQFGGTDNDGTVFKITSSGTHTLLHSFNGSNGSQPYAGLAQGRDGDFYGTTAGGGASDHGTVFKITSSGTHTLLHSFNNINGSYPRAALVQGSDGDLYGTTALGGAGGAGTVFKITPSGTHNVLYSFDFHGGNQPNAGLVQGSDGDFYGTTYFGEAGGYGGIFKISTSGMHTMLHSFNESSGSEPYAGLVRGSDGDFYGTTHYGGTGGRGTVFKITSGGTHTVLHSFDSTNGSYPLAALVQGSDGDLYGTTQSGGPSQQGTIFKISVNGTRTLLHNFNGTNGSYPRAALVQGSDGDFYGTTYQGGASGYGTVFKITSSGTHTLLHSFNDTNGRNPAAGLVLGSDGDFYGTTYHGGASGHGTVFKITSSGTHALLHSFNSTSGGYPSAGLVEGSDGCFYGTTQFGGTDNDGTVFKITSSGMHTLLHSFNGTNGSKPYAGLAQGSDGNFYGTTQSGGVSHFGTVFKISASGACKVLHLFDGGQAAYPRGTPIFGPDDCLYGTANRMAVWRLNINLVPDISLSGNGQGIVNGDDTPSEADHTYFGVVNITTEAVIRTFTITNTGELPLLLTGSPKVQISGEQASDFAVTMQPDSPLAVAGQTPFTIAYTPTGSGVRTAMVSIASNAPDHPVYSFVVQGMGVLLPAITLSSNGQEITNGDDTPVETDHTDFASVGQALGASTRTFTITNTGDLPLQLTGTPRVQISGAHAADFQMTAQPDSPVAAGEAAAFTVAFDPSGAGVRAAMVSIASDASNAPLFTFAIRGTGTGEADTKNPTLKLTTPAGKTVSASSPLTVAGVAGDGFAVDRVEVVLNGGEMVLADLNHGGKPSAVPFSAQITPVIGENTLVVTAYDPSGNSTTLTRVFTFERRYLLTLAREVPAALEAMPDKAGTLALKAATAKNATALTKGSPQTSQVLPDTMLTLTAAAKTGHLFSHWIGLPEGAQVRGNVAAFLMPAADMGVTAVFVANPLTQGAMAALGSKPVFQGLLRPDETTPPGNDTVGFLSAALTPAKGSLSGKLWMDGMVTAFAGALHGDGTVWFKADKDLAPALPFADRTLTMTWSESGLTMTVIRAVNEVTHVSEGQAKPPLHSKTTPVRGTLLDAKGRQGYLTLALPAVAQSPVKAAAEYPQGSGHAGVTLLANGTLKLAGTLAEGTKVTAASFLVEGDAAEVFIVLPTPGGKTKAGSLLGTLVFDEAQADTDVTSTDMQWFRPGAQTKAGVAQAYRAGWPGGIVVGVLGALYDGSVPVQTALGLAMTGPGGNAALVFQDGKLAGEVSVPFNLDGGKVVKLDARDKTWSLKLTPKTGLMSGTFTSNWPDAAKKLPAFSGVILQKGGSAGGRGFFLSNAAGDTEPESGGVELGAP